MNLLSGEDVTLYNITFKYFNILIVLFNLVLLPYWASFTDAYFKADKGWITTHIQRLILVWIGIFIGGVFMFFVSSWAFKLWIGKSINADTSLSIFMLVSILLSAWNSIFSYFLNGISKVGMQKWLLILAAIINIPLSFYLVNRLGASGAIIATCISLFPTALFLPFQYRKIINEMEENQ